MAIEGFKSYRESTYVAFGPGLNVVGKVGRLYRENGALIVLVVMGFGLCSGYLLMCFVFVG